jgi:hypothetical protein
MAVSPTKSKSSFFRRILQLFVDDADFILGRREGGHSEQ